ncbi:MAG: hypothetical protein AAB407_03750 [Patescibacteria group bacterium]
MSKHNKDQFNNPVSKKDIEMKNMHRTVAARLNPDAHSFNLKPVRKPKASGKKGNR